MDVKHIHIFNQSKSTLSGISLLVPTSATFLAFHDSNKKPSLFYYSTLNPILPPFSFMTFHETLLVSSGILSSTPILHATNLAKLCISYFIKFKFRWLVNILKLHLEFVFELIERILLQYMLSFQGKCLALLGHVFLLQLLQNNPMDYIMTNLRKQHWSSSQLI